MRNPRIRPEGFWRAGAPLEPWEAERLDRNQSSNVNADGGESFDSETVIVIGGAGMHITAPWRVSSCSKLALVSNQSVVLATRSRDRFQPLERALPDVSTDWAMRTAGSRPYWEQFSNTTTLFWVPLRLPVGSTLTSVRMTIVGAPSHSLLPASPPQIAIAIGDFDDQTPAIASTSTDASGSIAVYEAAHTVSRSGAHVVDASKRYFARIKGESGTNSTAGMKLLAVRTTVTLATRDEWTS